MERTSQKTREEVHKEFQEWRIQSNEEELKQIKEDMKDIYNKRIATQALYYFLIVIAFLLVGYCLLTITNALQPIPIMFVLVLGLVFIGIIILKDRKKLYDEALRELALEGKIIQSNKSDDHSMIRLERKTYMDYINLSHIVGNRILIFFGGIVALIGVLFIVFI